MRNGVNVRSCVSFRGSEKPPGKTKRVGKGSGKVLKTDHVDSSGKSCRRIWYRNCHTWRPGMSCELSSACQKNVFGGNGDRSFPRRSFSAVTRSRNNLLRAFSIYKLLLLKHSCSTSIWALDTTPNSIKYIGRIRGIVKERLTLS